MHSLSHLSRNEVDERDQPAPHRGSKRQTEKKREGSVMINAEREGPYLKRTSFLAGAAALGLADDDDANSSGCRSSPELCGALSPLSDGPLTTAVYFTWDGVKMGSRYLAEGTL
jgi:hypothetical protein